MALPMNLENTGRWMRQEGSPDGDVVVSSRVRLARNISGIAFPHVANEIGLKSVRQQVTAATAHCDLLKGANVIHLETLTDTEKQVLVERHLINQRLLESKVASVIVEKDEVLSIMVNEEDHLRIQALEPGLAMVDTWRVVDTLDNDLESHIDYAFRPDVGFCTACPTNVGTGMRASVLVHLPGLVETKQIDKVLKAVSHLGLAVRGFYGEGTEPMSNFFQISNQITLSRAEEEIVDNIEKITRQIASKEREARKWLYSENHLHVEDSIFRAWGILRHARLLSSKESMSHLSMLRLGVYYKLIPDITTQMLNELFVLVQPAHLCVSAGKDLQAEERDVARAELIRTRLRLKPAGP
ncbi:MAG: protein arginine kinase [Candidatus Lindowbacteria bacterium RIFCSPLOWO2_12_FULL_62_27]|nr:MAG: protein arginine kinase [Candidatus Lindowbacteria bacterium RIFCSPLOWO2_12_FULL_62_27]OGH62821.1 MAG: protein arginine kinase [Candidatus Lindowbacteria bacterium RIFCSPLOWO2_02_FULL_62_12]